MATVQIRNLSDEAVAVFKRRADESGRSLQEYLRLELERQAAQKNVAEVLAEVRADLVWSEPPLKAEEIVEAVHEGRRA